MPAIGFDISSPPWTEVERLQTIIADADCKWIYMLVGLQSCRKLHKVSSLGRLINVLINRLWFNSCLGRSLMPFETPISDQLPKATSIARRIIGPLRIIISGNPDLVSYCDYRFYFPIHMNEDRGWKLSPDFISPQAPNSCERPTPISSLIRPVGKSQLARYSKRGLVSYC
jgi:hypothetical protein